MKDAKSTEKKDYSAPELTQWGSVRDLTEGILAAPGDGLNGTAGF